MRLTQGPRRLARLAGLLAGLAGFSSAAGAAENWQLYLNELNSPIMERIIAFNDWVQLVMIVITLFVVALLAWVMIKYNAKANPVPSKTSHNTVIEVLWTILPVLILVSIAIPSFGLLFAQYDPGRIIENYNPEDALTVKATGKVGWYWTYEYPDRSISFSSFVVRDAEGNPAGEPRLLDADNPLVVPVNTVVRLQTTADADGVIHSFAMPELAMKLDAVPGRLNEMWFLAEREGVFRGQCSELCGAYHYAMPIELRVVSKEQFEQWAATAARDLNAANQLIAQWEGERKAAEQVASR